jgi:hypothetical protein
LRATSAPASIIENDITNKYAGMRETGPEPPKERREYDLVLEDTTSKMKPRKTTRAGARMRKLITKGTSQARRFAHHSGNDAASATKAITVLQINGEIAHVDIGPTIGTHRNIGNTIASVKNTVPMIARPLWSIRFLSILPPFSYAEASPVCRNITCAPISSECSTANCVAAAESGP